MRRALQLASMIVCGLGLVLWFFGGMNTGPSQWAEDPQAADAAHAVANERRHVFRPGIGFLGGSLGLGLVFLGASLALRPRTTQTPD
jgi:hypothetical protein